MLVQGIKHRVCSLFPSQCSPVILLGMFSLETCWDGILASSGWDGFIWLTLKVWGFGPKGLLGLLKITEKCLKVTLADSNLKKKKKIEELCSRGKGLDGSLRLF